MGGTGLRGQAFAEPLPDDVVGTRHCGYAGRVAPTRDLSCTLTYEMKGFSAFYKHSEGSGVIHCSNGKSLPVKIEAKGGGLTFGKSEVHGTGKFAGLSNIRDAIPYPRAPGTAEY